MKDSGVRFNALFVLGLVLALIGPRAEEAQGAASGVTFVVGGTNGQPGAQVLVPVRVNGFLNINSFQFSFHWSPSDASFLDVEQFGAPGLAGGNFGTTMTNNGTLTVSWDDPDGTSLGLADGTILFMARLQVLGTVGTTSSLSIDGTPTPVEVADGNLNMVSAALVAGQLTIGQANTAPALAPLANKTINEGSLLTFRASASDVDVPAQTLTYTLGPGAPAGASIDPASGVFTWIPTEAQGPSSNALTIRVTDNGLPSRTASQTITIIVNEINSAPVLAAIGNKTVSGGNLLSFTASAFDNDLPPQVLTYTLDAGAPLGTSIDPATGIFNWTPTKAQAPSTNRVTVRVSDNGSPVLSAAQTFTVTVSAVNTAPVLAPIGGKVVNEGSLLSFVVSGTDADIPAQTLSYSLDPGAPAGASLNPNNGLFTWTPTEAQGPGAYSVKIRVTDSGSPPASASETITITVNEVNTAPVLAAIANKTVNEGSLLSFTASATDADLPAQTLTYSLDAGAPLGANIDSGSGTFTWTPTEAQGPSTNLITIRVTDSGSQMLSAFQTITVLVNEVNSAPVLAGIGDKTVNEGSLLTFPVSAADSDLPAQTLTYSLGPGAPAGASVNPATGVFNWTPTEEKGPSTNLVTIQVTDNGFPPATAAQTITIIVNEVNTAPVIAPLGNKVGHAGTLLTCNVSATDADVPAQILSYSLGVGAPAGANIDPLTGVFSWTPAPAQAPSTNLIAIRVTDNGSPPLSASQILSILVTIEQVNTAPVLAPIGNKTVNAGSLLTFLVSASDADLPAQTLAYTLDAGAPVGVSIDPKTGVFAWIPTQAQAQAQPNYSFAIRVTDNGSPSASASETITISANPVNTAPMLAPIGNQTVNEGSLLTFTASATDLDLPAQMLSYSLDAGAPAGMSINSATGSFAWTPMEGQGPSTNQVTIRVTDNGSPAASASETITVIVNRVNNTPPPGPIGNKTINEGSVLTFNTAGAIVDLSQQNLTYSLAAGAPVGATIDPMTGLFTWTPTEAQGPSTNRVTIRVSGPGPPALSASQTFTITVNEVNSAPLLASIGNKTINEGTLLSFMASASDTDIPIQTLTFSLDVGAPTGASINPISGLFTWTPAESQGPSTNLITIRVTDNGFPPLSASEEITIIVNEVNSSPVLAPIGNKTLNEGTLLTFRAFASDADIPAQILTYSLDAGAPAGARMDPTTGVFTWTPTEAQGPSTITLTVRVTDNGSPTLSAFQNITITVYEVNSAPVLASIETQEIEEGALLSVAASASDPDIPAQTLTYSLGAGAPVGAAINPVTGVFTWAPTEAQGPSTNLVAIRVTDNGLPSLSATQHFTIIVHEVNSAPLLAPISNKTVNEGALLRFSVLATDADLPRQTLTYSLDAGAPTGASINPTTGVFSWTPTEAQGPSTTTITLRVTDNGSPALTAFQSFTIRVNAVNSAPVLAPIGNKTVNEGSLLIFTAPASDADIPAQNLSYSLAAGAPSGASIDPFTGVFTWTPAEIQGPSTNLITIRVTDDGVPALSASQTFTIIVNEVNTAPVLSPVGNKTIHEGALLTFKVSATDADLPAQILTYSLGVGAPAGASINPTTGVFTWTPAETQGPSATRVEIRVTDNGHPALSASEIITITVSEVNSAPVLAPIGNKTVNEGALLSFKAVATDSDIPAQTLTYSLDAGAPAGASIDGVTGVFTWTPTEAQGPSTITLTVRVTDNGSPALSAFQNIIITVFEINSFPVLAPIGNKTIDEQALLTFAVSAFDPDIPAQTLSYSLAAGAPLGASINPVSGIFTWTPSEAQGPSTNLVTIRVTDNGSPILSASQTISITVNEVNSAPMLAPISLQTVNEGTLLTFRASARDADIPAQILTYSLDAGAPAGASINPTTGVFTWTPTEAQGPRSYATTVRVTDNGSPALSASRTVTIIVNEVNTAPVLAAIGNKTVNEGSLLTFPVPAADMDIPAQTLTYSLDAGAPAGASIDAVTGVFTWTPAEAQGPSVNAITIRVTDNGFPILSASQTITVTVHEVNTAPALLPLGDKTVNEGSLLTFKALAFDGDIPAQTLTFSLGAGAPAGASINPTNGVFAWRPSEAQGPGTNLVTIRVTDNGVPAASASETIAISINEVNTAPVLAAIGNKTVNERTLLTFKAAASDLDLPPQTLTYSLDAGAPPGAGIDPVTGVFTWMPAEAQGPSTISLTVRVTDNGSPALSAFQNITITVVEVNSAPMLAPVPNQTVTEGNLLAFSATASDPDIPAQTLTYSLGAGAPVGATINPVTGFFTWVPTEAQGPSTNLVAIRVTDNALPSLSATQRFTITVVQSNSPAATMPLMAENYLEFSVGKTVVRAGQTGSVPLCVTNVTGVTSLSASIFVPTDQLSNLGMSALDPELDSGTFDPQGPGLSKMSFSVRSGQILQNGHKVAQLNFTAVSTHSAFVPLIISNVVSMQSNGVPIKTILARSGRVVVVGSEPLLEPFPSAHYNHSLVLYGLPGTNYLVESTSDEGQVKQWQAAWQGTLTNLFQVIHPDGNITNRLTLFRALRQ